MKGLSPRQQDVLEMIQSTVSTEGRFPSVREIGASLGISSPATVSQHIRALLKKKFLEQRGRHYVVPDHLRDHRGIPVVGRVAAGAPITSTEHVEDWLKLESMASKASGETFAVKVMGDSMIDDGILEGDFVLVDPGSEAVNGAVVVAYLGSDQEVTVKRFYRRPGGVELRPANPAYTPLQINGGDEHFRLAGRVVGLLRRL
ncbi:MAG: transcriptional repressor LexA [Candidatus Eisenbacteria bacterium]|uniref:LexA repressor n=1 Tax=Eiseniibacteriota bacterium TaxID=2212470 RepID=A0A948RXJ9_UNCEI|nr:transcriptional repressor LexA [Candidatus Eisenbacteria bacterium]MBU1950206.1 transcriptional repressor LexA [Candidatus Eisenbacteria bacterium]MBU2691397.1 transcriptional repressor LexA [Candidatus Eisenbacteria bacterium]